MPLGSWFRSKKTASDAENVFISSPWRHHRSALLISWVVELITLHKRPMAARGGNNAHYSDVIMSAIASQITGVSIVYSTVWSSADQRRHPCHWFLWGEFTGDRASIAENVSIWWRHHEKGVPPGLRCAAWRSLLGSLSWYNIPIILIKPWQLIWKPGTPRIYLPVPDLHTSYIDLTKCTLKTESCHNDNFRFSMNDYQFRLWIPGDRLCKYVVLPV